MSTTVTMNSISSRAIPILFLNQTHSPCGPSVDDTVFITFASLSHVVSHAGHTAPLIHHFFSVTFPVCHMYTSFLD